MNVVDELPRIFDVGYRGSRARTPGDQAGAGLGLAIARALTEAQHGRISVVNQQPGCRFEIALPLAGGGPAPTPCVSQQESRAEHTNTGYAAQGVSTCRG